MPLTEDAAPAQPLPMTPVPYEQRLGWFHGARFGLFIHYGLYSIPGRGEWVMFSERIPAAEYARLADRFKPDPDAVKRWIDLAVGSGTRYAVLTARHHDGFSLFRSPANDFNLWNSAGRDLVAEFTDACRAAGLRVGLYYSLLDWRFPGYFEPAKHPASAEALAKQVHGELEHLMSAYGRIDLLWYDGGWIDHGRKGTQQTAFWRSHELNQRVYDLQPNILINNRSGLTLDLDTPEQKVAASEPGRAWEACMTIGDSAGWGWLLHNPNRKTEATLIQNLVTAAAGEGNFLINVGPRADGTLDPGDADRLRSVGAWLREQGEGIYGSQRCELYDQAEPGAPLGRWTRKGTTAYLYLFRWPGERVTIPLVDETPRSARLLSTGEAVAFDHGADGRLHLRELPPSPPHPSVNAIAFEFDHEPRRRHDPDHAAWIDTQVPAGGEAP